MMHIITCIACVVAVLALAGIVVVLAACPSVTMARLLRSEKATIQWWTYDEGSDEWRVLRQGHYIPRYHGSTPTAAALTSLAAPISVREAAKACRQFGMRCELMDLEGRVIATVDRHGTVRVAEDDSTPSPAHEGGTSAGGDVPCRLR